MGILSGYYVDIKTDREVNAIIKWWNDTLFEQGYVPMDEFELKCNVASDSNHWKYCWSFELTTDRIKSCIRKDAYHVKSSWHIYLPEPEIISQRTNHD